MGNTPGCCSHPNHIGHELREEQETPGCSRPTNKVQLAATELFSLPGLATAFHTSVLVNDEEFFFSDSGICSDRALTSHQGSPTEPLMDLGYSSRTGYQLLRVLQPHFPEGSYDLVRKNCNSFSDCAVHYLLGRRLDRRFSALERLGMRAGTEMVEKVLKGMYLPNEAADGFSVSGVISAVEKLGDADVAEELGSKPCLAAGEGVTLVGLRSASHLNGKGATILRFNAANCRWEARLHISGEVKAFRAENMRPAGELILDIGDLAKVHGLQEQWEVLNGREGEVLRYVHETSRYRLRVGDEVRDFRAENLEALRLGVDANSLPSQDMLL